MCSYAAPNATSEAGKQVLLPRMADRGKNGVASTTEALVRFAVSLSSDAAAKMMTPTDGSTNGSTNGMPSSVVTSPANFPT